jgi:hypothetical protein
VARLSGGPLYYSHGDAAELTGRTFEKYGTTWHEIRLLEGHLAGELRVISARQLEEQCARS